MEDPTNMRKSTDEVHSFEDSVTPTWFTSAANVTRNFSEKLLAWGVEERGAYPIAIRTWSSLTRQHPAGYRAGFVRVLFDRHPPRRRRGENRNALYQHILFMVYCKYEPIGVRVPFFFITTECRTLRLGTLYRFAAGTLGPVTFGLGLRDSYLVILIFNLFGAIPPAYL
jgi:hypothetical protein